MSSTKEAEAAGCKELVEKKFVPLYKEKEKGEGYIYIPISTTELICEFGGVALYGRNTRFGANCVNFDDDDSIVPFLLELAKKGYQEETTRDDGSLETEETNFKDGIIYRFARI